MKTAPSTPAATRRLRRRVISTLLGVGAFVGAMIGAAPPADAASGIYGCFRRADNGSHIPSLQVNLQAWNGSAWQSLASYLSDLNGCVYVPIPGELRNYHVRFYPYMTQGHEIWYPAQGRGITYANPGHLFANVGFGYVTCNGCRYPW